MAMPSARPTITMARPKISGRSLTAASAAAPAYATAMPAPIDDPATAIAAPISAVPLDAVEVATSASTTVPPDGPAVTARMNRTAAAANNTALRTRIRRIPARPRHRRYPAVTAAITASAGRATNQTITTPPGLRDPSSDGPERARAGTA